MSDSRALVLGSGPSGLTCAHLLRQAGWRVDVASLPPRREPVIVLNEVTAGLLNQLWGLDAAAIPGANTLRHRQVRWTATDAPITLAQTAIAVPLAALSATLARRGQETGLRLVAGRDHDMSGYDWIVHAGGRRDDDAAGAALQFGRRVALAARVRLTPRSPADRCILETVPGGWLFLAPLGSGAGSLQCVTGDRVGDALDHLQSLVASASLLRPAIVEIGPEVASFDAMPRLGLESARPGSIDIGDAALALDPISGDGVGCGLRTAVLAAAVMTAIATGDDAGACLSHYRRRLRHAARSHVRTCIAHYRVADRGTGWRTEIDAMTAALARCPAGSEPFAFQLGRTGLERIGPTRD